MRSRVAVLAAAISLTLLALLTMAGGVFAHASIISVAWDNPASPTRLTGRTGGPLIDNRTGSFHLRVFDSAGRQVDLGNAAISTSGTELTVSVMPNLPAGTYRADWLTTGEDGERDSGSFSISIGAAATQSSSQASAGQAATAHGDDGHSHGEQEAGPARGDEHAAVAIPSGPVTFEVRATGANQVPPVSSTVSAFGRFRFDPATRQLRYDVTVSGASANLITAAHVHRGKAGTTGPHAFDMINAGFTQISGSWQMGEADVMDLLTGNLYLNVHSVEHATGAARAQLIPPGVQMSAADSDHETTVHVVSQVTPPRTGDAGLLGHESSGFPVAALAVLLVGVAASLGGLGYVRRRS